ncbi:T9SS type A sorting domain-containing protein [Flavobacterium kingsejongi]|uniref:Secretion system C-terminal sorting domain-containing protein n=1 Tax=Flavobacterium kingsejongi TaxID=1678728 RepID=A0A2S1LQ23_9FLAO|nr:T9SS type A sorting domain-containing protein [Flavobacterium kingsejongi]AWG25771.1 hypothetical protein FK004_11335 [Flavobacterium kingsejongi]
MAIPLNEIPISSFCTNANSLNLKRTIPINYSGRPKAIKISNVFSFREWSSFETSNVLQNSFNGSLILNPENISNLGWSPSGKANFNPKNIELKNGTPNYTVIQISQKISGEIGELNGLPKRLKIKLLTRNFPTSTTNNDDFYIKILKSNDATNSVWEGRGTYLTNNTSNATYNNFNTYSITPNIDFDSNSDYWLLIDSSAPTLANSQIKSIVIEPGINNYSSINSTATAAEKDDTQDETEELQRIVVDNTIKFYPNPVKEKLTIEVKNGDLLKKVEVFDEVGKYIGDFTNMLNNNTIDITSLPSGNYIIKTISLTNTSEVIIKK